MHITLLYKTDFNSIFILGFSISIITFAYNMEWILTYIIPFLIASDVFFLSIAGGVTIRPFKWLQAINIAITYAIILSLSGGLAFLLAQLLQGLVSNFAILTGHILLMFVGIRLINDARKVKNEERTYILEDQKIMLLSAAAASFIVFLAFLGYGFLLSDFKNVLISLSISVLVLSLLGVFIGSHYQPLRLGRSSKFASGLLISIFIIIHYINHL